MVVSKMLVFSSREDKKFYEENVSWQFKVECDFLRLFEENFDEQKKYEVALFLLCIPKGLMGGKIAGKEYKAYVRVVIDGFGLEEANTDNCIFECEYDFKTGIRLTVSDLRYYLVSLRRRLVLNVKITWLNGFVINRIVSDIDNRTIIGLSVRERMESRIQKKLRLVSMKDKLFYPNNVMWEFVNDVPLSFHEYTDFSKYEVALDSFFIPMKYIEDFKNRNADMLFITINIVKDNVVFEKEIPYILVIPMPTVTELPYYGFNVNVWNLNFFDINIRLLDKIKVKIGVICKDKELEVLDRESISASNKATYISLVFRQKK